MAIFPEALAHTVRGMAIILFLQWALNAYRIRNRSRMMWLYFMLSLGMALCYLKDLMFIFEANRNNPFADDVAILIDLLCVPLACSFFFEVTKPHGTRPRCIIFLELVQGGFLVAYLLHPSHDIVSFAFYAAFLLSLVMLQSVIVYALRFRRYVNENYSYTESISVSWVVVAATAYTLLYFIYYLAFDEVSWTSEAVFNLCCILLWGSVYMLTMRHNVVDVTADEDHRATALKGHEASAAQGAAETAIRRTGSTMELEASLRHAMEEERAYLNPRLTLVELAVATGTNRTYLSQYLHDVQRQTFYDYINSYRIKAACRLIEEMATRGTRINIAEVAAQSGFNSTATFYRYFSKKMGFVPGDYYNQVAQGNKK